MHVIGLKREDCVWACVERFTRANSRKTCLGDFSYKVTGVYTGCTSKRTSVGVRYGVDTGKVGMAVRGGV
jgi:hypothetical protein